MVFHVNVNALGSFKTVAEARTAAQAIEILLSSDEGSTGGVKIYNPVTHIGYSVTPLTYDHSTVVYGSQESESNIRKYVKFVENYLSSTSSEPLTSGFWDGLYQECRKTGTINLVLFEKLVTKFFENKNISASEVICEAVASVAANDTFRVLQTAHTAAKKQPSGHTK